MPEFLGYLCMRGSISLRVMRSVTSTSHLNYGRNQNCKGGIRAGRMPLEENIMHAYKAPRSLCGFPTYPLGAQKNAITGIPEAILGHLAGGI